MAYQVHVKDDVKPGDICDIEVDPATGKFHLIKYGVAEFHAMAARSMKAGEIVLYDPVLNTDDLIVSSSQDYTIGK